MPEGLNKVEADKTPETLAREFWSRVYKTPNCWFWIGESDKGTHGGYGRFRAGKRGKIPAHVFSWELANGKPFPPGKFGTHECDIRQCVRPDHIVPRTHQGNMLDAAAKGSNANTARALKTHCLRGHEFTKESTRLSPEGRRSCKRCARLHWGKHGYTRTAALKLEQGR
jgi:HNH endonuclease